MANVRPRSGAAADPEVAEALFQRPSYSSPWLPFAALGFVLAGLVQLGENASQFWQAGFDWLFVGWLCLQTILFGLYGLALAVRWLEAKSALADLSARVRLFDAPHEKLMYRLGAALGALSLALQVALWSRGPGGAWPWLALALTVLPTAAVLKLWTRLAVRGARERD